MTEYATTTAVTPTQATGAILAKPMSIKDTVIAQFKDAEAGLQAMADRYRDVVYDVATPKGMREAIAARAELRDDGRRSITRAEKKVKEDVAALKEVMSQEVERLVAIVKPVEDAIDAQIKAQEQIKANEKAERERVESERVGTHRGNIERLRAYATSAEGQPLAAIKGAIDTLGAMAFGEEWEEFAQEAQAARDNTVAVLRSLVQREEQRIENEQLRAQLAAMQTSSTAAPQSDQKPADEPALQALEATETAAKEMTPTNQQAAPFQVDGWDDQDGEAEPLAAEPDRATPNQPQAGAAAEGAGATMTLGQMNTRLAPISISSAGLAELGFEPVATVKAAKLYRAADFARICQAIAKRAMEASTVTQEPSHA